MPSRTENSDQRWRFNQSGQLVDSEATNAGWELADEIVRLKIGEVTGDVDEIVPIRTPPQSKLANAVVAQLNSDSPLDAGSNPSAGSSPQSSDHQISISHSRGSSIDTTNSSSHESVASHKLLNHPSAIKPTTGTNEVKERPRSLTGNMPNPDLRRLQQAGVDEIAERQQWMNHAANQEQPSYPSLANHVHRPQPQQPHSMYDIRTGLHLQQPLDRDETIDYIQTRNYNAAMNAPVPHPSFVPAHPPAPAVQGMGYRQTPRGFAQQGMLPGPSPLGYPGHTSHLSLGNTQQLYDMMLPVDNHHPAVNRVQQQHNVFRATHHHSASDPSTLRDAATLALLNSNMQAFAPGMFQPSMGPPPPGMIYPSQYYGGQEVAAQLMAARLQAQYTGSYNVPTPSQGVGIENGTVSPTSSGGQAPGPSANNRKLGLYKTELCRSWEEKGTCRYGAKCQFAHGEDELRKVSRHPKYKTEICRTFWVSGSCPYGKRCCFIHTELPSSGATPPTGAASGTDSSSPQPDGRARSMSTNSDPNDASTSLLARLKNNGSGNVSTPIDTNNNFQFTRPPTGSLRVDTSVLDGSSIKQQNKSAYPTFASNGILLPAPESIAAKSSAPAPGPVTAGPDLGRYNAAARLEIVGYNSQQGPKKTHSNSNPRHSFSGEIDLNFSPSPPLSGSYGLTARDEGSNGSTSSSTASRVNGHVRAGSAGNWSSLVRSNLSNSAFPRGSSPAGDIMANSPWGSNDIAVSASRLHEKAWA